MTLTVQTLCAVMCRCLHVIGAECACVIGEMIGERVFCCGRCGLNPSTEPSIYFLSLPTKSVTNLVNVKISVQMVRFNCKNWKDFKVPSEGVRETTKQKRMKSNYKSLNIEYLYVMYLYRYIYLNILKYMCLCVCAIFKLFYLVAHIN